MTLASISYPPLAPIHLGMFHLSVHGVVIAVAFLIAAWLATRHMARAGGDVAAYRFAYQSVLSWALVGAVVGARYFTAPAALLDGAGWSALSPLDGSFSILGGFTGGIVTGLWRMRVLGMPILPTLDISARGLALGTVIGRIGCLAIADHLGRPTTLPWGYGVKPGYDVAPAGNALECTTAQAGVDGLCGVYQPVALYDLLAAALLLLVLYLVVRRLPLLPGQLFAVWMAWYGLQRFVLDFLRVGDAGFGPISWNQLSGLAGGMGGVALLWWLGRRRPAADSAVVAAVGLERARV
jgi:phosphatidylglycerol:prolipoprotein diacylglycerol transferase